jgi:hypothetical protein
LEQLRKPNAKKFVEQADMLASRWPLLSQVRVCQRLWGGGERGCPSFLWCSIFAVRLALALVI